MAENFADLGRLTPEQLVERHDKIAANTSVGVQWYLDELHRRDQREQSKRLQDLTEKIARLTWCIVALTAGNLVFVAVDVFK